MGRQSVKPPSADGQLATREYLLGLHIHITDEDVKSNVRIAVARMRKIWAHRASGLSIQQSPEEEELDRKLLAGELEILVAPGQTISLHAQPQVVFRPTHLVLDDEAAEWYDVVDVKVGKNSQLVSGDRLPGTAFRASTSPCCKMDIAQISMYCAVSVVNVSDRPQRLPRAMLRGVSGDYNITPQIAAGLDFPTV